MSISINELVTQLSTLGLIETAINGAFHNLPGSGGSGGTSNVRMLQATLTKASGPTGFGNGTITYGFGAPVQGPFVQVVEAVLSDNVEFKFEFYPNPDGLTGTVTCTATAYESGSPTDEEFPKTVLVRVEPFVATA